MSGEESLVPVSSANYSYYDERDEHDVHDVHDGNQPDHGLGQIP